MTVISIVAHRGGTEATLRAGNSLLWLAGSFTGKSVHQTRSVEGAGGGRWRQKTGLEHLPSSNWRERWWVMKWKKMLYFDLSCWLGFRILRWCVWYWYALRLNQYIYKRKKHSCESALFRRKQHTDLDELMAVMQELPCRIFQVTGNFRWQADDKFHIIHQTFAGK